MADTIECIAVSYGKVRGSAAKYPYFQPAAYRPYVTKDGRLVWKYTSHLGKARRSQRLALADARSLATDRDSFVTKSHVRQYRPVTFPIHATEQEKAIASKIG